MEPNVSENIKPNFFPPLPFCAELKKKEQKYESLNLFVSNPARLLLLYETLTDKSSKAIEVKLNNYLTREAECKSTFLLHLFIDLEEARVQTIGKVELETVLKFPIPKEAILNLVRYKDKTVICDDVLNNEIYNILTQIFDNKNYKVTAVPVLDKHQKFYPCCTQNLCPILLACYVDSHKTEDFLVHLTNELFKYCLHNLLNIMAKEAEVEEKNQLRSVIEIIQKLFANLTNIKNLVKIITQEAARVTSATKCSLHLKNQNQIDFILRIFNSFVPTEASTKIELAGKNEISDYVTSQGDIINIYKNCPHSLARILEDSDKKNILCFPLKAGNDIIGAIELCNKRTGDFNNFDQDFAYILSKLCGFSIVYSLEYASAQILKSRIQLSDELMLSYIQVDDEDVDRKVICPYIHSFDDFDSFDFNPRIIVKMETVCYVLVMFEELDFFQTFSIDKRTFTKFVFYVKDSCHNIPYHNWMHLFATTHFAFLCLKNLSLVEKGFITKLEALVYFIACLCHDVDNRSTINPFQQQNNNNNDLANLYSSCGSVMERHRLSQIFRMFNKEGCNILENFTKEDHALFLNLLKDMVLATDLATHFKFYSKEYDMVWNGYKGSKPEHRYVLVSLLMTCSDLSDYTKDWSVVKTSALDMYEELFTPNYLKENTEMDRTDPYRFPELQIEFTKQIVLPAYKLLARLFPIFKNHVFKIKKHILSWECSKNIFLKLVLEGHNYREVLEDKVFDKKIDLVMKKLEEERKTNKKIIKPSY